MYPESAMAPKEDMVSVQGDCKDKSSTCHAVLFKCLESCKHLLDLCRLQNSLGPRASFGTGKSVAMAPDSLASKPYLPALRNMKSPTTTKTSPSQIVCPREQPRRSCKGSGRPRNNLALLLSNQLPECLWWGRWGGLYKDARGAASHTGGAQAARRTIGWILVLARSTWARGSWQCLGCSRNA